MGLVFPPPARDPDMAVHAGGSHQERERQGGPVPVLLPGHHPVQAARGGGGVQQRCVAPGHPFFTAAIHRVPDALEWTIHCLFLPIFHAIVGRDFVFFFGVL